MQFHYINTNEAHRQYGAYKKWLNLGYGFTNGELKFGEKLGNFQPGDLVFMYVKGRGIKAVGMVMEEWDGVEYREPIIPSDTNNEFRVRINWFCVLPDGFVSPSEIKEILGYGFSATTQRIKKQDLAEKLLRHFLQMLESSN